MRNCLVGLAIALASCGDNSRECGEGTIEENGNCIPAATCGFGTQEHPTTGECIPNGSVVCSDGTVFDELTGSCKIDPNACQAGTVLVDEACVDPTAGLLINVQEGPEPNGLGVIEDSLAQAGNIIVPPTSGDAFIIHGTIDPHRDANNDSMLDPDIDTYVLTVGAPVFLRITADGVAGTAAGFIAVAAVDDEDPLVDWQRVGLSVVSDTSVREVFLPSAGTYRLAIGDTRTLLEYVTSGTATAAPGDDSSEYYVSIKQIAQPAATPLTLVNGRVSLTQQKPSDELRVFSAPLGTGLNSVRLATPSALVQGAVVVTTNNELRTSVEEVSGAAAAFVGNVDPQDATLIVVDQVYALAPLPVSFTLDVAAKSATALSPTGGTVVATATANNGADFSRLNQFSFDVTADDATVGMFLSASPAIVGHIYDDVGNRAASFTTASSWSSYRGLVRLPRAGRYYFAVFAPTANSSTQLSITSTIAELTPRAVTQGTPLDNQPISSFRVSPFTYDAGTTDAWQQFDVVGVNTGGQNVSWFDPAIAYGRLDSLSTSGGVLPSEVTPIFTRSYGTAGGPIGRVLLSDPSQHYFVKVNAVNPTTNPMVALTFAKRAGYTDLGTVASGTGVVRTSETLSPAAPQRLYLFRTGVGNTAMITITPTSMVNTQFRRLRADETPLGALINVNSGPDVETFVQTGSDWTAFVVSSAGGLNASRTFDVSVQIQ